MRYIFIALLLGYAMCTTYQDGLDLVDTITNRQHTTQYAVTMSH